ncbi:hypothetical protein GGF37_002657 [Kickxella alabastrina]|nr:hypothetical protein GGF37_002657 [Kickxella alabastrina]
MASINCGRLAGRSIRLLFWLSITLISGIALLGTCYAIYQLFLVKTIVTTTDTGPTPTGARVYRMHWQEQSTYEAKMYASTRLNYYENTTDFFETAQMLWHIEPQSLENKYPLLQHSAKVKIPASVYLDTEHDSTLYLHLFMQTAGQFTPHPNTTDSQMVTAIAAIAWWQNPNTTRELVLDTSMEPQFDLIAATNVPWAIVLEDHAYKYSELPRHILYHQFLHIEWGRQFFTTYRPPLLLNQYTRNPADFIPVSILRSNKTAATADNDDAPSELAVEMELELQGIRQGWIVIKDMALQLGNSGRDYKHYCLDLQDLVVAHGYPTFYDNDGDGDNNSEERSHYRPLTMVEKNGMPILIIASVLMLAYAVMIVIQLKVALEYWVGPVSNFDGISRAAIILCCTDSMLRCMYVYLNNDIWNPDALISVVSTMSVLFHIRRPFSGFKIPSWFGGRVQGQKPPVEITADADSRAAVDQQYAVSKYQDTVVVTKAKQQRHIIELRKETDKATMYWMRAIALPVLIATSAYAFIENDKNVWELGYVLKVISSSIYVVVWFELLPQILVNYRVKSGSLMPAAITICGVGQYLVGIMMDHLTKNTSVPFADASVGEAMRLVCDVVIIAQWAWYRKKVKQD